jgi:hypothetical protein
VSRGAAVNFEDFTTNYCNSALPDGEWLHIAVTYDGAVARIYRNGTLMAQTVFTVEARSGTLFIGGLDQPNYAAQPWAGAIDEVVFFDRAFSQQEVARLYADGVRIAPIEIFNGPLALRMPTFLRGDSNLDGKVDLSDAQTTLSYLFLSAESPRCLDAADADDNGKVNTTDSIATLQHLFQGGPTIPEPSDAPGTDPTPDELECNG